VNQKEEISCPYYCQGESLMKMNPRREFLSITLKGATMVAATTFLPKAASASDAVDIAVSTGIAQTSGSNGTRP
jgi:hypothetical protein